MITALQNDDVFVMVGGIPPIDLLKRSGVSFDKELRSTPDPVSEEGTGLVRALSIGFSLSLFALAWVFWHQDYYSLPAAERATHINDPTFATEAAETLIGLMTARQ